MKEFSTPHTRATRNPQTYFQHGKFALSGAFRLLNYGISSIVHALFPEIKCLQFHASSGIIRLYRALEKSGRHDAEIEKIFGKDRRDYIENNRGV